MILLNNILYEKKKKSNHPIIRYKINKQHVFYGTKISVIFLQNETLFF